jgi:hypothetical protein
MDEITGRAFAAYFRGGGVDQPAGERSGPVELDGKSYIALRNDTGILAVYRVRTTGALRRLRRWPRELEAPEPSILGVYRKLYPPDGTVAEREQCPRIVRVENTAHRCALTFGHAGECVPGEPV